MRVMEKWPYLDCNMFCPDLARLVEPLGLA
jgi:hypothetical protein